ncbi:MAG: dihydropteroate synthase [Anaerovoracaceae bacterium]
MIIGNKHFDLQNRCYIMGILNVTPDSFSDGGKFNRLDKALKHAEKMIDEGADIIDVGGESTRPGHEKITDEEEINRTAPVVEAIKKSFDVPVSIDTYKSSVAEAALKEKADLINDIWGFKYDRRVADLTARYGAVCCLMHNRDNADYADFFNDFTEDMKESIAIAKKAGIDENKIILDPGVGFGKTLDENLKITNNVDILKKFGYPILLGTSRKSMIGLTLNLPVEQRLEGTLATTVIGVMKGCSFVRVHDVKENKRVIDMTEAILAERQIYG